MIKVIRPGRDTEQDIFRMTCDYCDCEFFYQRKDLTYYDGINAVKCPTCKQYCLHSMRNRVMSSNEELRRVASYCVNWKTVLNEYDQDLKQYEECAREEAEAERALNEHEAEYGADGGLRKKEG